MIIDGGDKVIIDMPFDNKINGLVIGIKPDRNNTVTYFIEPLRKDFGRHKNGARLMKLNSRDIETGEVKIKIHTI